MSLLKNIQNEAINSQIPLADVLRKCKLLAYKLGNKEIKEWVELELNGYQNKKYLPQYRIIPVNSKGEFFDCLGNKTTQDIPMSCIDKEYHKDVMFAYFLDSVAGLEEKIKHRNHNTDIFSQPWIPEITLCVRNSIYNNLICKQAWKIISVSSIINVLDNIRNRVLTFVLEIEAQNPKAGEVEMNTNPIPEKKLTQIINTTIHGNVQNVATGSSDFTQNAQLNSENEKIFEQLLEIIKSHSNEIDGQKYKHILDTINEMKDTKGTQSFSGKYVQFIELINSHAGIYSAIAPFIPALTKFLGGA